ncbi:hypothetical protein [Edaphobacter albus]|uniref:hypothetical protein n=1 Tax=Edaphobacter sp. 4G125 TaxID=2763071 RepID=UPI0016442417|nr:hypothetical protein [Edaphobacter sp. 4G125]QNI37901.1 hypothetical protein H7846_06420 [Edaphobacter sp. 4G125]
MKLRVTAPRLILLLGALFVAPQFVVAQSSHAEIDKSITDNIGDAAKFQTFFASLKQAVEKHDAAAVAAMVSYPITVNPRTKAAMTIRTPQSFITQYDKIMTPHIAEVITKQKYEDLFVNYQGAMLGSGEVWITGICKDKTCKQSEIKIRTIQNTAGKGK